MRPGDDTAGEPARPADALTAVTLPAGTVTFLFTDIEGSTRLLRELGDRYLGVRETHDRILREAIAAGEGIEIGTEGDAFFAAFPSAAGAVRAAVTAQRRLAAEAWPIDRPLRVRMGLHTGEAAPVDDTYIGMVVNEAARIAAAANGGQVLLSEATRGLVFQALPDGVALRDVGTHQLKDLASPERLYDLVVDGLAADFAPIRSIGMVPNNLPVQRTSFVGREPEIRAVGELLGRARLVTLTGPGGTGKTRLALEVARRLLADYRDGAFFVDLSPLRDPGLVASAVAQGLGVAEQAGRPLVDSVVDHVRHRRLLLVLDNFEQVIDGADVVEAVLGNAAEVRQLVTSRTTLHLYGEQEFAVEPLGLPGEGGRADPESMLGSAAVALFAERAAAVKPDFRLTADNAAPVAGIVARLDGLPLAIELAASRIKLLPPGALLARLGKGSAALGEGSRDLPERQRTLQGAIAWSYELLAEPERRLLDRLSIFAGGAGLEAIEAVTNPDSELAIDTLDGISGLVDHSLVRPAGTVAREPRFRLLETIREFAADRLEASGDGELMARRHAAYHFAFAERAAPHFVGEAQADWLELAQAEHDNLRAALGWVLGRGEADTGLRLGAALWRFWQQRGHLSEGRRWIEALLDLPGPAPAVRFPAHVAAGGLAYWMADWAAAERHYGAALDIARVSADRRLEMEARYNLGFVPLFTGDLASAGTLFEESAALASALGDAAGLAHADAALAWLRMLSGDYEESIRRAQAALATFRRLGNRFEVMDQLATIGQSYRLRGDLGAAREPFGESLALLRDAGDRPMTARVLFMVAATASAEGDHGAAMRLWGAAETIRDSVGGIGPLESMRVDDAVAPARAKIGGPSTDTALAEGRQMSPEEAVAFALAWTSTDGGHSG